MYACSSMSLCMSLPAFTESVSHTEPNNTRVKDKLKTNCKFYGTDRKTVLFKELEKAGTQAERRDLATQEPHQWCHMMAGICEEFHANMYIR